MSDTVQRFENERELFKEVQLAAATYHTAAARTHSVVTEYADLLIAPAMARALRRAAEQEREAIEHYLQAVKAFAEYMSRD